ncbi:hypothetical protein EON64_04170, partial [archaeon]
MADLLEEDDFKYEEIPIEQFEDNEAEENALLDAFNSLNLKTGKGDPSVSQVPNTTSVTQVRPSVVDDFIRNFLIKGGMKRTLDQFNTEWYELQSKGKLPAELSIPVPDIYLRNEDLDQQARKLREEVEKMREIASKAQATWDKFRKERDFHRMHHQRVVQEKAKLVDDIRRLKNHMRSYEPAIEELKRKYEAVIKEKMLVRYEDVHVCIRLSSLCCVILCYAVVSAILHMIELLYAACRCYCVCCYAMLTALRPFRLERDRLRVRVKALEEQVAALAQPVPEDTPGKTRKATRTVRK